MRDCDEEGYGFCGGTVRESERRGMDCAISAEKQWNHAIFRQNVASLSVRGHDKDQLYGWAPSGRGLVRGDARESELDGASEALPAIDSGLL